jgi:hypothetical protein
LKKVHCEEDNLPISSKIHNMFDLAIPLLGWYPRRVKGQCIRLNVKDIFVALPVIAHITKHRKKWQQTEWCEEGAD